MARRTVRAEKSRSLYRRDQRRWDRTRRRALGRRDLCRGFLYAWSLPSLILYRDYQGQHQQNAQCGDFHGKPPPLRVHSGSHYRKACSQRQKDRFVTAFRLHRR